MFHALHSMGAVAKLKLTSHMLATATAAATAAATASTASTASAAAAAACP